MELSHPYSQPVYMAYRTLPGAAGSGVDFQPRFGLLKIRTLGKTATVTVGVTPDLKPEPDEKFFLKIVRAFNARSTGTPGEATIVDDDH